MRKKLSKLLALSTCLLLNLSVVHVVNAEESTEDETSKTEEVVSNFTPIPEGYTRYEAEDAEISNGLLKGKMEDAVADYGTYSGTGFVGELDYKTSRVTFSVTVAEDGNYPLNVGYAVSDTFGTATFSIYVNATFYASISLSNKKGWGAFKETGPLETSINLYKGENSVAFVKGYNYGELDYIDIGPRNGEFVDPSAIETEIAKIPEGYTRYEAENGKITSGVIYKAGFFSGTGYVGDLDKSGISSIEFTVNVKEKGEYELRLAYTIGDGFEDAVFKLYNDDGLYTTISCDKKFGWGNFEIDSIASSSISLNEGDNKVGLYSSVEFAQVDFIDISNEKIGEYKESNIQISTPNLEEGYTRLEAEDQLVILAEPKGVGFIAGVGSYSGYGYVGSLDNDNCYVEIPVSVPEDGEYEIKIAYASIETGASLKLYSGTYGRGGNVYFYKEVFFENYSKDWGFFTEDTISKTSICLKKGKSFIIVKSGLIRAEIDYIDLGAKIGDYYDGTYEESFDKNNKGE